MNEGTIDRMLRLGVGALLVALGLFAVDGAVAVVLLVVGAIALVTGAVGFCPLYRVLGISTARRRAAG